DHADARARARDNPGPSGGTRPPSRTLSRNSARVRHDCVPEASRAREARLDPVAVDLRPEARLEREPAREVAEAELREQEPRHELARHEPQQADLLVP